LHIGLKKEKYPIQQIIFLYGLGHLSIKKVVIAIGQIVNSLFEELQHAPASDNTFCFHASIKMNVA
jgi:hypothetical protein